MRSSPAPSICAILAAAGVGSRLAGVAGSGPKQFLALGGRPIYQWSLCELAGHEQVGLVVVATLSDSISTIQAQIEGLGLTGRTIIIAGGSTRQQSVWLGLKELSRRQPPPGYVLVHDAARPFLTREILDATITVVKEKGACTTCVPASDTVKRVQNGQIVETLDRNSLVLVQTPQAARYDWLRGRRSSVRDGGRQLPGRNLAMGVKGSVPELRDHAAARRRGGRGRDPPPPAVPAEGGRHVRPCPPEGPWAAVQQRW